MNRSTLIIVAAVLLLSVGVVAYGNQVGFIWIENEDIGRETDPVPTDPEPTTTTTTKTEPTIPPETSPEVSVSAYDAEGTLIDWASDDEIVSGNMEFSFVVTNADPNVQRITNVILVVNKGNADGTIGDFVGSWVFDTETDQEKYNLDWDTTLISNGQYILQIKYTVNPAIDGGGGDDNFDVVAFSMGLDTSSAGVAGISLLSILEANYVLPLLAVVLGGGIIAYLVLRFRR